MNLNNCYLKFEKEFWTARGRKTIFPVGTKFIYEMETMSSVIGGEVRRYFVYAKPKVHVGHYEEDEFHELFMTKEEFREQQINKII